MPFYSQKLSPSHLRFASRKAFTLIELLVVIAIIAILSIVVVLTLNPAQLLMQSRDSDRVSDMSTLNSALGIYSAQGGLSLGSSNVVYVSIPDPTATSTAGDQCQGLGLISLPAGYSYFCAASSTYRSTNGTGWIPVNFASMAAGSPLSILPIDPVQSSSSRLYYTYTTNGSQYELTSNMESAKYQLGGSNDVIGTDGGTLTSVYEKGSKLGLEPLDYGDISLVGLWSFNEGTGTVAYDYSGNNATGSWSGTQIGTNGTYYSTNAKVGTYSGDFDGSNNCVNLGSGLNISDGITLSAWIQTTSTGTYAPIINKDSSSYPTTRSYEISDYNGNFDCEIWRTGVGTYGGDLSSSAHTITDGNWHFVVCTSQSNSQQALYVDGSSEATTATIGTGIINTAATVQLGGRGCGQFSGFINDIRIYNRALTTAQIAAMYAGGK